MKTTEMYVEYIIIGLESLCWIFLLFFIAIGTSFIDFMVYCVSNIFPTIVLLGICYILGLVVDRTSDMLLAGRKKKIKDQYLINAKTSMLVWKKYGEIQFAGFTLSRIRILRSTIFNSAIIGSLSAYLIYKYYNNSLLMLLVLLLFGMISLASNSAHKSMLDNYYNKTSILDKESEKKDKKK